MSRRRPDYRNDVMHAAFANIDASTADDSTKTNIMRALKRFRPSKFGGWRKLNGRRRRGKRNR